MTRRLVYAYVATVALFALAVSILALRNHYVVPYIDDWRILDDLFRQPFVEWVFADQAGHRIPVTLLLVYLDYELFGGRMHLLVVGSLLCAGSAMGVLGFGLREAAHTPDPVSRVAFAFAGFTLFWAASLHDFIWGMNQGTLLGVLWLVVALVLAARYALRGPTDGVSALIAAMLAAVFATFSHGMGAATWVALLVIALAGRFSPRAFAGVIAGALLTLAVYARGLTNIPGGSAAHYLTQILRRGVALLEFACSFVGAPAQRILQSLGVVDSKSSVTLSTAIGVIGALAALAFAVWVRRTPARRGARGLIATGLMAFAFAGGALVGLNRIFFGPETAVAVRFVTWASLFWIGGVLALSSLIERTAGRRVELASVACAAVLSAMMLPALAAARLEHSGWRDRLATTALVHWLGVENTPLAGRTFAGEQDRVYRVVERFRRDGRNLFADPRAGLAGTLLEDQFEVQRGVCRGSLPQPTPMQSGNRPAGKTLGWLASPLRKRPDYVVITDTAGVIRGIGRVSERCELGDDGERCRWLGIIADYSASERYAGFAIRADAGTACRLGTAT